MNPSFGSNSTVSMSPEPTAHKVRFDRSYFHRTLPVVASRPIIEWLSVVTTTPYAETTAPSRESVAAVHRLVNCWGTVAAIFGVAVRGPIFRWAARISLFR